ncbi:MAG TPA: transketolase [Rectinemataceae bacterium]|nr:transketolase [Rectinemataceae bacterium]
MNIPALEKIALSVRSLSIDAIQAANSGHPGLPLGAAELGAWLYGAGMRYDPARPDWLDRDRFVLSAGHGSMFLYSLLHLAGFPVSLDEIKRFRQLGSPCAGHPEYHSIPGIETTTGPLGQGVANAVGLAIAETMLAARLNSPAHKIVDHYTYVLAGDGCLQEGVSAEASSLAGHLGLGKLIMYYDSNSITIDGSTGLSFTEEVGRRYEAYGWQVLSGDMYNYDQIAGLTELAKADAARPTLIILKSVIGKGSPGKAGTAGVHGSPLGAEELAKTKANLGIPADASFWIDPAATKFFESRRKELAAASAAWDKEFAAWKAEAPDKAALLDAILSGKEAVPLALPTFKAEEKIATRAASGKALAAVYAAYPALVGGSADLTGPNSTALPGGDVYSAAKRDGRYLHFGIREHGMASIANGLALHGLRPFVATFLTFVDYLKPALRLAALMRLPVVYVMTHDSIYLGEDGPTHQPIEHLASCRSIPNVLVLRPADAEETAQAWKIAMERRDGPTIIALSRQNLSIVRKDDPNWRSTMAFGAYIARKAPKPPRVVVVASGSEVELAFKAVALLEKEGKADEVGVVSMPCREAFFRAPAAFRESVLPPYARVIVAEAGVAQGWERLAKPEDILSIESFGESGPAEDVARHFGFEPSKLAAMIRG